MVFFFFLTKRKQTHQNAYMVKSICGRSPSASRGLWHGCWNSKWCPGGLGALGLPPGFRNVKDLARSCAGIVTSQRRSGAPHQTPSGRGRSLGVCGPQCLLRLRTASAPYCLRPAAPVLVSELK